MLFAKLDPFRQKLDELMAKIILFFQTINQKIQKNLPRLPISTSIVGMQIKFWQILHNYEI